MRNRIVGSFGNRPGLMLNRPPEVGDEAARVADHLKGGRTRRRKQDRRRPTEGFDVLRRLAEALPHVSRDRPLAAEIGEGRDQAHAFLDASQYPLAPWWWDRAEQVQPFRVNSATSAACT